MKFLKILMALLALTAGLSQAASQEEAYEGAAQDETREYVRIRCLYGDRYLYQKAESDMVHFAQGLDPSDQHTHWYLENVPEAEGQWIRNRVTGDAMHMEGQAGFVEIAPLEESFHSYRWNLVPVEDYYHIQNVWKQDQYICLEDTEIDIAGHDVRNDGWWSLRFKLDPVAP